MRLNYHWRGSWLGPVVLVLVVGEIVLVALGKLAPEALLSLVTLLVPNPLEPDAE
jgi:hypothetical protein